MSSTGTRPPLFDPEPEPEGFDAAKGSGTQQFPQRRSAGGPGYPRARSSASSGSSPRWVRPFIFGGLVLIAVISLVSILASGDEAPTSGDQPTTTPVVAAPPAEDADPVGSDVGVTDAAELPDADAPDADAAVADAEVEPGTVVPQTTDVPEETADLPGGADAGPDVAQVLTPDLQVATAFAVQFTHDYLNYDQAQPDVRERDLRAYLAPGLDPQLGWDGQGTQVAVLTVPIQTVTQGDRVVVTVAAQVTGEDAPRWVHLAVPLAQDQDMRWAVIAQPAYVPRPGAGNPASDPDAEVDPELSSSLTAAMEQLFRAYATEGAVAIGGVTAPGATIRGLQGQVTFVEIDAVRIMAGDGDTRTGSVTVTWNDAITGGSISQTYVVDLVGSGDGWLVEGVAVG